MNRKQLLGIFSALGILLLILDSKTAMSGASEGITLCIGTVIPSLFPFLILSILLTSNLAGIESKPIRFLGSLCGIPRGCESILLVGLLGGYPVGAQAVSEAYGASQISRSCAQRMLGFCSNAGPAFLFGIVAGKFTHWWVPWLLWSIHIFSSLIVGALLPGKESTRTQPQSGNGISIPLALERAVRTMALICGWVILFRVFLSFLDRWILWLFPVEMQICLLGLLELTNGCCELEYIQNEGLRFITASAILGFGGLCVGMQTASVAHKCGLGWYLPGKIFQSLLSILIASVCVAIFFPPHMRPSTLPLYPALAVLLLGLCMILLRKREKRSSNPAIIGI